VSSFIPLLQVFACADVSGTESVPSALQSLLDSLAQSGGSGSPGDSGPLSAFMLVLAAASGVPASAIFPTVLVGAPSATTSAGSHSPTADSSSPSVPLGLVLGAALGGCLCCFFIVLVAVRRRAKRKKEPQHDTQSADTIFGVNPMRGLRGTDRGAATAAAAGGNATSAPDGASTDGLIRSLPTARANFLLSRTSPGSARRTAERMAQNPVYGSGAVQIRRQAGRVSSAGRPGGGGRPQQGSASPPPQQRQGAVVVRRGSSLRLGPPGEGESFFDNPLLQQRRPQLASIASTPLHSPSGSTQSPLRTPQRSPLPSPPSGEVMIYATSPLMLPRRVASASDIPSMDSPTLGGGAAAAAAAAATYSAYTPNPLHGRSSRRSGRKGPNRVRADPSPSSPPLARVGTGHGLSSEPPALDEDPSPPAAAAAAAPDGTFSGVNPLLQPRRATQDAPPAPSSNSVVSPVLGQYVAGSNPLARRAPSRSSRNAAARSPRLQSPLGDGGVSGTGAAGTPTSSMPPLDLAAPALPLGR
jgi:hypothetical protein